ncbi:MAG: hypothetical protein IJ192_12325 [Clostridia bacterium]|nr:hypothetical protein [Clostridia bacterium]
MSVRFLEKANLPQRNVSYVVMSDSKPEIMVELINNYHVSVITPEPLNDISGAEQYHADMCLCHLGGNSFSADSCNTDMIHLLKGFGAEVYSCDGISAKTPKLNVSFLGDKVICNTKKTDPTVIEYCNRNHIRLLHTNQSYAKCSTAIVSENAVITADSSIFRVCRENDIDVLKISHGHIALEGYDYGFIGGTCGLINKNTLVFSGNIGLHKDYENIKAFASNYNVDIISLGKEPLYDIGGILPITEQAEN